MPKLDAEQLLWLAPEPTTGSALLSDVEAFCKRFVVYPDDHAAVAHALWVAHAHAMAAWDSTPRLLFSSPEPGSGKSRALEVTELLVPDPVLAVNVSPAYLFRKVGQSASLPTILYDEIDTVFGVKASADHEDIRGLLNAGHRKGAVTGRVRMNGKTAVLEELPAYSAVAFAGLRDLPDTLMTRSVVVRMRKRAPGESVEPFRRREQEAEGYALRERLDEWMSSFPAGVWPELPDEITDRDADLWESLIAVADWAGGEWPLRARAAGIAFVAARSTQRVSLNVRLLGDVREVWPDGVANLASRALVSKLSSLEDAPWRSLNRGAPIDAASLANLLKPYGIEPTTVRTEPGRSGKTAKGYKRLQFEDAWTRYL